MAAATFTNTRRVDFSNLVLHQFAVTGVTDNDTLVTGIKGIRHVMTRRANVAIGSGALGLTGLYTGSTNNYNGNTGTTRRIQAFLSDAETGEITFDNSTANAGSLIMIWASR